MIGKRKLKITFFRLLALARQLDISFIKIM